MAPMLTYATQLLRFVHGTFPRASTGPTAAAIASVAAPSLNVPACPNVGTVTFNQSVPNRLAFPLTKVDICYEAQAIHIDFTAYNETSFYYNSSFETNDPIYEYEVMEAFISKGTNDPQTYLEFEVAPNNVTFNAFIFNPSKVRDTAAPFDRFQIPRPLVDGLSVATQLDREAQTWTSCVRIPLGLFNVDDGQAKGTQWRMNFFRTVVDPETFPAQFLGAWSVPDAPSFHKTPFFGILTFI